MQMRREPVPQLAGVRRQIEGHLPELINHGPPRALVPTELPVDQALALAHAGDDGPHEEVRHVDGHGLRKGRELGGVGSDDACVAASV